MPYIGSGTSGSRSRQATRAPRGIPHVPPDGPVGIAVGGQRLGPQLAPYARHALDVFGPDRLMFGSDWPVCTLAVSNRVDVPARCPAAWAVMHRA
ncbi:amidohydrolase family protein [Planobispora rosea]|uniref:amidohydrolase family protein n=1 Tax=Planobispora rosea TaxID=35762 RepID=UPI001C4010C4|nr:amidohydrolase family protein [Planobispora rosea]